VLDFFNDFASRKILGLLDHYFPNLGGPVLHDFESGGKVILLIAGWWLVDNRLKPHLERWQARIERHGIERFASDVLNAAFAVRIYDALVRVAYLDAAAFAFPEHFNNAKRQMPLLTRSWQVPRIEALEGLAPLPEVVRRMG
jgi:hypothetical protein